MFTENRQKNETDLKGKHLKRFNAVHFWLGTDVFKKLPTKIDKKSSYFDLLQNPCIHYFNKASEYYNFRDTHSINDKL